ncbi:hypothetical protein DBR17_15290, partial [Sphingomonas sp. HMWF008]
LGTTGAGVLVPGGGVVTRAATITGVDTTAGAGARGTMIGCGVTTGVARGIVGTAAAGVLAAISPGVLGKARATKPGAGTFEVTTGAATVGRRTVFDAR